MWKEQEPSPSEKKLSVSTRFTQKLGNKIQWLFHDQFKLSMTKKIMLKTRPFWGIFLLNAKRDVSNFQTSRNIQTKKWNSTTFPWPQPFFLQSITFPGLENTVSNSTTFHDVWTMFHLEFYLNFCVAYRLHTKYFFGCGCCINDNTSYYKCMAKKYPNEFSA